MVEIDQGIPKLAKWTKSAKKCQECLKMAPPTINMTLIVRVHHHKWIILWVKRLAGGWPMVCSPKKIEMSVCFIIWNFGPFFKILQKLRLHKNLDGMQKWGGSEGSIFSNLSPQENISEISNINILMFFFCNGTEGKGTQGKREKVHRKFPKMGNLGWNQNMKPKIVKLAEI